MVDFLLKEDGSRLLQENGSLIILDAIGPVTSVSIANGLRTNNLLAGLSGKTVIATIPYLYVTWTPTTLGAAFAYYEVQRVDGDGSNTIALITDESKTHFADYATRRGESVTYRVRVGHTGGTLSAWVNAPTSASVVSTNECEIDLIANTAPQKCLALYDTTPKTFTLSTAGDVSMIDIEGRDTPQGFISAEGPGEVWTSTFLIAFDDPGIATNIVKKGRQVFAAIKSLLTDPTVEAITVLNSYGDRWYTTPKIGNMVWLEPVGSYKVDVTFNETASAADTPVVVTANPWQPSFGGALIDGTELIDGPTLVDG